MTVNLARNWVVPKAAARRTVAAAVVALAAVGTVGCGGGLNPFALPGKQFLGFLVPALLAAVAAGLVLRAWCKDVPAAADPLLDWQRAAVLVGGPQRLPEAVLARLAAAGAVRVDDGFRTLRAAGPPPPDVTPAERAVLDRLPAAQTDALRLMNLATAVGEAAPDVRRRLDDDGLTLPAAASRWAGTLAALPVFGVLLVFGLPRLLAGMAAGRPVGFLVTALCVGLAAGLLLFARRPDRTRTGDRAVADLRKQATAANGIDADRPLAVAALGTGVLAGTELAALHHWYPKRAADDGGDGVGADGGCGGGGGG